MKMGHAQKPVRTVAPAELPVSLATVKDHLRVTHSDEDTMIAAYLAAAVGHLDGWSGILGRCLVTQTWRLDMTGFPASDLVRLPFPDVQSVTVAYTDAAGDAQTFAGASYHLIQDALGAALVLAENAVWPVTDEVPDAARVTMVCGFGGASAVPDQLKAAILLHCGALYENRESMGEPMASNGAYEMLTSPFRRVGA